ncbi:MAG: hypothetical protein LBL07_20505 [Tannerella sp.]|jgi:hypothetical protein|nr:hypothetical protein [Tannerella sp.]
MKVFVRNQWKWIASFVHSALLMVTCYALWNNPYTFSGEASLIQWLNVGNSLLAGDDLPKDLLLVNIAYDREFVDFYDEKGLPCGQIDITDRSKLTELFRYVDQAHNHKYIICDVYFDASLQTPSDDSLYALIGRIPRLVVPKHEGEVISEQIAHKAACSDYKTNIIENNLLKYQYLQHGEKSIPVYMWSELTGGIFEKTFFGYRMNGKVATNSIILNFQTQLRSTYNGNDEKNYLNLGADLLEALQIVGPEALFADKTILIGDFCEHDIHSSVVGNIPGILINYNACLMLEQDKPVVGFALWAVLFIVFMITSFSCFSDRSLWDLLLHKGIFKRDVIQFFCTWLGLTFVLTVLNLLIYFVWGRFIEIFIFSGYFTFLKTGFDMYYLIKNKKI